MISYDDVKNAIPYTRTELDFMIVYVLMHLSAVIFQSAIIYSLAKQRDIPKDSQFILAICIADVFYSSNHVVYLCLCLADGSYNFGQFGCIAQAFLILYFLGSGLLSIMSLTLYRYLIVVMQVELTQLQVYTILASSWIGLMVGMIAFVATGFYQTGVSLQGNYCMVSFSGTDRVAVVASFVIIFLILSAILVLTMAYTHIFYVYKSAFDRKAHRKGGDRAVRKRTMTNQEKKLLLKSVCITFSFIVLWMPYGSLIVYEMATHTECSPIYKIVCEFAFTLVPLCNGIVLFTFDAKVKQNLMELITSNVSTATRSLTLPSRQPTEKKHVVIETMTLNPASNAKSKPLRSPTQSPTFEHKSGSSSGGKVASKSKDGAKSNDHHELDTVKLNTQDEILSVKSLE